MKAKGYETDGAEPGFVLLDRLGSDRLLARMTGVWKIGVRLPRPENVLKQAEPFPSAGHLSFETSGITSWDTSLVTFLSSFLDRCAMLGIQADTAGLPPGVQRLLQLAGAFRSGHEGEKVHEKVTFLERTGGKALGFFQALFAFLLFVGGAVVALGRLLSFHARFRFSDFMAVLQESGPNALPIIFLISALVGIILAFVGAVQLRMFNAEIYIADVVGISMAREMGPMMTAIVMMGRTGASFAAQLGAMETNEEIDALRTLGIDPMEFLVLPRMIALIIMIPLLTLYSDVIGILSGALTGIGMFGIPASQYYEETKVFLTLNQFGIGLAKSVFFGSIIAASGCFYGMRCGRSASAVGDATTRSVVSGIVFIIVADGTFAVITSVLGI